MTEKSDSGLPEALTSQEDERTASARVKGCPIRIYIWNARVTSLGTPYTDECGNWAIPVTAEVEDNAYGIKILTFTLNYVEMSAVDDIARKNLIAQIETQARIAFMIAAGNGEKIGRYLTEALPKIRLLLDL